MRTPIVCLLVLAACGREPPKAKDRPEEVARATFEALKLGRLAPLEPHLMTVDEAKRITGIILDDTAERERFGLRLAQQHERLDVDWATAAPGRAKVKYDAMGQGALVTLPIRSERGTISVDIAVAKVGARFVFTGVKPGPGAERKEAAAEPEEEGEAGD